MNIHFFLLLFSIFSITQMYGHGYDLDYTKANKNTRQYEAVPQREFIWMKAAALEPMYFYQGNLRGHGWQEPMDNEMINKIRENKHTLYVDYFTTAKMSFYIENINYSSCKPITRPFSIYKRILLNIKKNQYKFLNKFQLFSIPRHLGPAIGIIAIGKKKRSFFKKHLYYNTNIYNTKSILDDPNLYTVNITGMWSYIHEFIYATDIENLSIKPIYKKRLYDFVASNAIQVTMMLKAGRMDYADMTQFGDYYAKQLNINNDEVSFYSQSTKPPHLNSNDDTKIRFIACEGHNLNELKNIMNIINSVAKKLRGNKEFWTAVMKQFAKDTNTPYVAPEDFYFTKEAMIKSEQLRRGDFDVL